MTCAAVPPQFDDDARLLAALAERGTPAERVVWDDPDARWDDFDRVVIRSTWDYPRKHERFVAWADAIGERLRNSPALVRWNADKRHLDDLARRGVPVVPTTFVRPGEPVPPLVGEVVVKPTISAGGRNTGRFGRSTHAEATGLVARIHSEGQTAMVQPYVASVDRTGETTLVFIAGHFSHAARKRPVLLPDEVAPTRDDEIGGAVVMYDPDIVGPGTASHEEIDAAAAAVAYLAERFGQDPLYARVDLVVGEGGRPMLLELEAIEPSLFLRLSPDAAGRLADAILAS